MVHIPTCCTMSTGDPDDLTRNSYGSCERENSMCNSLSRCTKPWPSEIGDWAARLTFYRFMNCEKWRKDFKVDDLVRTFEYHEKHKVFEYYPQYYHRTDKVSGERCPYVGMKWRLIGFRMAGLYTLNNLGRLTSQLCTRLRQRNGCFKTLWSSTKSLPTLDCPPVLERREPSWRPAAQSWI